MASKIENVQAAMANIKESSISSASASRRSRGGAVNRPSLSKNQAASAASANGQASKTVEKPQVSGADSVSISAKADSLSRMQTMRSSGAEVPGNETKVGQDQPDQSRRAESCGIDRSTFQGFLSFIKTMVEQRANGGDAPSKEKESGKGNSPVDPDQPKFGFKAMEMGSGAAWAAEQVAASKVPVQETASASKELKSPQEETVKGGEDGREKSSAAPTINRPGVSLSQTEEKIGYFGEDKAKETETTNPLRDIVQEAREGQTAAGVLNGFGQILDKAETTTPFEKMAEKLAEQPAVNGTGDLLSGARDKVEGKIDTVAEKAEEKAEKAEEKIETAADKIAEKAETAADKTAEKAEEEAGKTAEKAENEAEKAVDKAVKEEEKTDPEGLSDALLSDALRKRVLNDKKLEKEEEKESIRESAPDKGASKKIEEDEQRRTKETDKPDLTERAEQRAEQKELRPRPEQGMETFGPYFSGISDRVAESEPAEPDEKAPAEQPVVGLKGVIHINNEDLKSSAVIEKGSFVHFGARPDTEPASNVVGNFSSGAENSPLSQALFNMRRGVSAYRSVDEMFG